MALKIFGTDPENQPKPRQSFADDVVGRFRSGHQINGRPAALSEWRITTGDPEVANAVFDLFGGDAPQEWEARGEDNLEVFTASEEIEILVEGAKSLRQKMILWGRNGKMIQSGDGEVIDYPEDKAGPDPDSELTFAERKAKAKDGTGPEPSIELYFRIAADPDRGIFKFVSGSWSMVRDIAADGTDDALTDAIADSAIGRAKCSIRLEKVEFTAKNGPQAGRLVSFTKPVLTVIGAAE